MKTAANIYKRPPLPPISVASAHMSLTKNGSISKYSAIPAQTPKSTLLSLRYNVFPLTALCGRLLSRMTNDSYLSVSLTDITIIDIGHMKIYNILCKVRYFNFPYNKIPISRSKSLYTFGILIHYGQGLNRAIILS